MQRRMSYRESLILAAAIAGASLLCAVATPMRFGAERRHHGDPRSREEQPPIPWMSVYSPSQINIILIYLNIYRLFILFYFNIGRSHHPRLDLTQMWACRTSGRDEPLRTHSRRSPTLRGARPFPWRRRP